MLAHDMGETQIYVAVLLAAAAFVTSSPGDEATSASYTTHEVFLKTSFRTYHMKPDRYKNNGNILLATSKGLLTTDGTTTSTLVPFQTHGFAQINATHVAVVDYFKHCIKVLNRETNETRPAAGTCGSYGGYSEGKVGVGKLRYPMDVQVDLKNPGSLLIADSGNSALRSVNLLTGELTTVIRGGLIQPRRLLWTDQRLFVTSLNSYISEVIWSDDGTASNILIVKSTVSGDRMGRFDEARLLRPYRMLRIRENLYLIADCGSMKLKLMNTNKQVIGPVCLFKEDPCVGSTRLRVHPLSLMKDGDNIYVGTGRNIYKLGGCDLIKECLRPNVTVLLTPGQSTVKVDVGDSLINLPAGFYELTGKDEYKHCTYYISVMKSPIVRRLLFKSKYTVTCDALTTRTTQRLLESVLSHKRNQLQNVCAQDCTMSTSIQPFYNCTNDLLTVYWPTDKLYSATILEPPATLTEKLHKKLDQSDLTRYTGMILFINHPLSSAYQNTSRKHAIEMVFESTCAVETQVYDAMKDTCS